MEINEKEYVYHNDCLTEFNNELYKDIFTENNIISKKKAIRLDKDDEPYYGFFLEKGREQFFMLDTNLKDLPFKVTKRKETDYKGEVFTAILDVETINIPAVKKTAFKKLVDATPMFNHSNPIHFLLYKIISYSAYIDRINYRVSTEPGFGKDSVANIISMLVNSTANLYGATFAKLEFVLMNRFIILNELGNLKKDELANMQEFLLATGAYFNTYTKRTRKTATTQEQYDISKLSLGIFYNLPKYYTSKSQEYFDEMFPQQVINRFLPFVFDGVITTKFDKVLDTKSIMERNKQDYKDFIATINFYKDNKLTEIKYVVPEFVKFPDLQNRYERTFLTILKYVGEYSESQEEFNMLTEELFKCFKAYGPLVSKEVTEALSTT